MRQAAKGQERNAHRILVKAYKGKKLGRPKRRWEGEVKMCRRTTGWGDMNWIHLAEDSGQSNNEYWNSRKYCEILN
jgi:hypothetical protein